MEKDLQNEPEKKAAEGGCVPTVVLMVGWGMLAVGLLSILNTAFGWDLELEVYGSSTDVPNTWESTIAVLVIGVILTTVGYLTGTPRFLRFYRKNKLLVIGLVIAIPVIAFLLLNEYDKSIKARNAEWIAERELLEAANPDSFAAIREANKPVPVNYYADHEAEFLVSNPKLDTMEVFLDGESAFLIEPFELDDGKMGPGNHRLAMVVKGDTVDAFDYELPERTKATKDEIIIFNVDSFFNIAVLNFQDYYDDNDQKRKGAKTINYRLETVDWHPRTMIIDEISPLLILPRHISLERSSGTALKLVLLPDAYEGDRDKAFDYAIWKFIDEEKKGFLQDNMDFYMLSAKEKRKAISNRLKDDQKRFEKEDE